MEKLHLTVDNQLKLLEKYGLTIEELFNIFLLFLGQPEEQHGEYIIKYYQNGVEKTKLPEILKSLQEKGIIKKEYKIPKSGQTFDPETVLFNKNFLSNYLKYSGDLGFEFYETYPHFITVNGRSFDIGNYAKRFNSEEEFYFAYGKAIGWKQEEHKKVLDIVKWAKETKAFGQQNIGEFVLSKGWNRLYEAKEKDYNLSCDYTESI